MKLPLILKGQNIFIDGESLHGLVGDIERPKITQKMEEYRAGGMIAPVSIFHGLEKLSMSVTIGGIGADVLKMMGGKIDSKPIRFSGNAERDDEVGFVRVVGEATGRITEVDQGTDTQGENGETKFNIELVRYKEIVGGVVVIDIDVLQNKYIVGGVDMYKDFNKGLGL